MYLPMQSEPVQRTIPGQTPATNGSMSDGKEATTMQPYVEPSDIWDVLGKVGPPIIQGLGGLLGI